MSCPNDRIAGGKSEISEEVVGDVGSIMVDVDWNPYTLRKERIPNSQPHRGLHSINISPSTPSNVSSELSSFNLE